MVIFPEIAFTKWRNNLSIQLDKETFLSIFANMYNWTKDPTLLSFNFKLLHRNIITNRNLNIWYPNSHSESCTFCNIEPETIEHMLYDCIISQNLWTEVFNWIHTKTGIRINFTREQILLGLVGSDLEIFNLIFLIIKRYIFVCKCLEVRPNKYAAIYKIKDNYNTEQECIRLFPNKYNTRKSLKWEILQDLFT